jgi:hypothetical protein
MHNPLSWLAESIKWEKGVTICLHRKEGGLKRLAPLFLCWSIIEYLLLIQNMNVLCFYPYKSLNLTLLIVYYKSFSDINWRENRYNWSMDMFLFKQNLTNYYLFTVKLLFQRDLYITFQVIYMINIVFFLNFLTFYKRI